MSKSRNRTATPAPRRHPDTGAQPCRRAKLRDLERRCVWSAKGSRRATDTTRQRRGRLRADSDAAGDSRISPVAQRRRIGPRHRGPFLDRFRLSGEGRLLGFQVDACQDAAVGIEFRRVQRDRPRRAVEGVLEVDQNPGVVVLAAQAKIATAMRSGGSRLPAAAAPAFRAAAIRRTSTCATRVSPRSTKGRTVSRRSTSSAASCRATAARPRSSSSPWCAKRRSKRPAMTAMNSKASALAWPPPRISSKPRRTGCWRSGRIRGRAGNRHHHRERQGVAQRHEGAARRADPHELEGLLEVAFSLPWEADDEIRGKRQPGLRPLQRIGARDVILSGVAARHPSQNPIGA